MTQLPLPSGSTGGGGHSPPSTAANPEQLSADQLLKRKRPRPPRIGQLPRYTSNSLFTSIDKYGGKYHFVEYSTLPNHGALPSYTVTRTVENLKRNKSHEN